MGKFFRNGFVFTLIAVLFVTFSLPAKVFAKEFELAETGKLLLPSSGSFGTYSGSSYHQASGTVYALGVILWDKENSDYKKYESDLDSGEYSTRMEAIEKVLSSCTYMAIVDSYVTGYSTSEETKKPKSDAEFLSAVTDFISSNEVYICELQPLVSTNNTRDGYVSYYSLVSYARADANTIASLYVTKTGDIASTLYVDKYGYNKFQMHRVDSGLEDIYENFIVWGACHMNDGSPASSGDITEAASHSGCKKFIALDDELSCTFFDGL